MGDNIKLGTATFVYLDGTQVEQLFDLNAVDGADDISPPEGFGLNDKPAVFELKIKRNCVFYSLVTGCVLVHRWRNHLKAREMICRSMRRKQNAGK